MMKCQEVAKLVSEMKDHGIPWHRRLGVRLHLMMCRMCSMYHDQLELITRLSRQAGDLVMNRPAATESMSTDAKERIKRMLSGTK